MKNWISNAFITLAVLWSVQAAAQSPHNHNQFHGLAPTIQLNLPTNTEGLFIEFRWRNQSNADIDGHVQLPAGFGAYDVTQTSNFSRSDQPFANGAQNRRIYPSQSGVRFNNNAAFAFHSGDQGGGAPAGVGCVEPGGGSCEVIAITGNVPSAQYGVGIHNFNFFNTPNSSADYDILVYATNGTAHIEGHESHLASQSVSGTGLVTGRSQLELVNYTFTGNSPHALGVPELISTLGHSVTTDKLQNQHQQLFSETAPNDKLFLNSLIATNDNLADLYGSDRQCTLNGSLGGMCGGRESSWLNQNGYYEFDSMNLLVEPNELNGVQKFLKELNDDLGQIYGASSDFTNNKQKMEDANTIGADLYFHCYANCEATLRGDVGYQTAEVLGWGREVYGFFKGDTKEEMMLDLDANAAGREGALNNPNNSCTETCESFIPPNLPEDLMEPFK